MRHQSYQVLSRYVILVLVLKHNQYMTNTYSPFKSRYFYLRKLNFVFFMSLIMMSVQACQFHVTKDDVLLSDVIRNIHAKELLPDKSKTREVREFNGDKKFHEYINTYIRNNSASMDSVRLTSSVLQISRDQSYDPIFLLAVMKTESKFNENAIGSAGEVGLMQIKPDTAKWICIKNKIHWRGAAALKDPAYNVLIASYYFKYLKKVLKSKSFKYISAYNLGLGGLNRMPGKALQEHPYFARVIENYLSIYSDLKKIKQRSRV